MRIKVYGRRGVLQPLASFSSPFSFSLSPSPSLSLPFSLFSLPLFIFLFTNLFYALRSSSTRVFLLLLLLSLPLLLLFFLFHFLFSLYVSKISPSLSDDLSRNVTVVSSHNSYFNSVELFRKSRTHGLQGGR